MATGTAIATAFASLPPPSGSGSFDAGWEVMNTVGPVRLRRSFGVDGVEGSS
jgi:hypothetical protein